MILHGEFWDVDSVECSRGDVGVYMCISETATFPEAPPWILHRLPNQLAGTSFAFKSLCRAVLNKSESCAVEPRGARTVSGGW